MFVLKWIQCSAPVFIIAPPFLSSLILFWFVLISSSSSPSSPKKHLEWLYSLNMYNLENIFLLLWKLAWLNIKLLSHTFIFSELSRYCSFVFWHKVLNLVFYCSFSILSIFCLGHHWIYFCKKGLCVLFFLSLFIFIYEMFSFCLYRWMTTCLYRHVLVLLAWNKNKEGLKPAWHTKKNKQTNKNLANDFFLLVCLKNCLSLKFSYNQDISLL